MTATLPDLELTLDIETKNGSGIHIWNVPKDKYTLYTKVNLCQLEFQTFLAETTAARHSWCSNLQHVDALHKGRHTCLLPTPFDRRIFPKRDIPRHVCRCGIQPCRRLRFPVPLPANTEVLGLQCSRPVL